MIRNLCLYAIFYLSSCASPEVSPEVSFFFHFCFDKSLLLGCYVVFYSKRIWATIPFWLQHIIRIISSLQVCILIFLTSTMIYKFEWNIDNSAFLQILVVYSKRFFKSKSATPESNIPDDLIMSTLSNHTLLWKWDQIPQLYFYSSKTLSC